MAGSLLEMCDRVRSAYHARVSSATLPLVREWVARSGYALLGEWDEALDGRGSLAAWLLSIDEPEAWSSPRSLDSLLAAAPFPRLHAVGFWRAEDQPWLPRPITREARLDRRTERTVASYLERGAEWASWMGFSSCRICGQNDDEMGCRDLSDGVWIWPEGLVHYVVRHGVALPDAFLDHVASAAPSDARTLELLHELAGLSYDRWLAWAATVGALDPTVHRAPPPAGWIVTSYETRGPYTDEQVRAQLRSGAIKPYHRLWKPGIGPARKARDMPGFEALCASIAPERL